MSARRRGREDGGAWRRPNAKRQPLSLPAAPRGACLREDGEVSAVSEDCLNPRFFTTGVGVAPHHRRLPGVPGTRSRTPTDSVKPTVSKLLGGPRGPRRCSRLRRSRSPRAWYGLWYRPPWSRAGEGEHFRDGIRPRSLSADREDDHLGRLRAFRRDDGGERRQRCPGTVVDD